MNSQVRRHAISFEAVHPFYRVYRRMLGRSIVGGVAPDPGSWHFALRAIMWQGFRSFFLARAPVRCRQTGAFCRWVTEYGGLDGTNERIRIDSISPIQVCLAG